MKKMNSSQKQTSIHWWMRVSIVIVVCSFFINMSLMTRAIEMMPLVAEGLAPEDEQISVISDTQEPQPEPTLVEDVIDPIGAPIMSVELPKPIGISGELCVSPLDFTDGASGGPDGVVGQGDAVVFTRIYLDSYGKQNGEFGFDSRADVDHNGVVNGADFQCAAPYYANNDASCSLICERQNSCHNPLDYNSDFLITLNDGVTFTSYYENNQLEADLNGNGRVDYGDLLCSYDQLAMNVYQCPIQCAPVCGDGIVNRGLGEQCDSGNKDGDGKCNAFCHNVTQCNRDIADYNDDNNVTLADAVIFTSHYSAETPSMSADIDQNGYVDGADYTCMLNFVNETPSEPTKPMPQTTPEPNNGQVVSGGSSSAPVETPKVTVLGIELPSVNFVGPLIQHIEQKIEASHSAKSVATTKGTTKIAKNQPATPPVLVAGETNQPSEKQVVAPQAKPESKPWWLKPVAFLLAW